MIITAREFATRAHNGQLYGAAPYTTHLDAVAALVGPDDVARIVAYLHDVVEDTSVGLQEVEARFGRYVAECVGLLTDGPGVNRKERKAASHAKLAAVGPEHHTALLVKAADRLANLEACVATGNEGLLAMYRREHEAFRRAAYRPGLCNELWERIDRIIGV